LTWSAEASGRESDIAVELWTWLFNAAERAAISAIRGVQELRDVAPPLTRSPASLGIAAVRRLPSRLRYSLPLLPVLQADSAPSRRPELAVGATERARGANPRLPLSPTTERLDPWRQSQGSAGAGRVTAIV